MTPPEYNIATLVDIARIPADRIPALLAELPRLLDQIREVIAIIDKGQGSMEVLEHTLIWVDDGITDGSRDETIVEFVQRSS